MKTKFRVMVLLAAILSVTSVYANDLRNPAQAAAFRAAHACPATNKIQRWCPGYVVGHIIPLCAGGHDAPSNMQWQTKADSYKKDTKERAECRKLQKASAP